jgi:hypothetical protein
MSAGRNSVIELLNDIKFELEKQLTVNNNNEINMGKLLQLSEVIPNRLIDSGMDSETRKSLLYFGNTLQDEATTLENLQLRLNDLNQILTILQPD